ncbi:MAG: ABC transporter permease [Acidobacteriota bacterium]
MPSIFEGAFVGLLSALYRAALVVCPTAFRSSFKAEMLDCYRRRLATEIHFGEKVSENYFQVLGREAALGRVFLPADGTQSEPVVVIGHSLWRDRFDSDPAAVGKAILMDSQGFTILGVMPPEFPATEYGLSMDFWLPISQATQSIYSGIQAEMNCRGCGNYDPPVARLRPGQNWEEAQAELDVISRRLEQEYSTELKDQEVHLSPAIGPAIDPNAAKMAGLSAWLAMALVGMVLLIACANVASLMIARADSRRRDRGAPARSAFAWRWAPAGETSSDWWRGTV